MPSPHERRAAALEAIAHALLELAAVERETEEQAQGPQEILIDRRNCQKELGLSPHSFVAAAGRDFPAFRVSKRLTATKADVLTWLKTRTVAPKPPRPVEASGKAPHSVEASREPPDRDTFLKQVHTRFVVRVGRPMTDQELADADMWIDVGHTMAKLTGRQRQDTADEVAAHVQAKIGEEPLHYRDCRSFGLDPEAIERDAQDLRAKVHKEHPEWGWRERQRAVEDMWGAIMNPLYEARRKARADARAAKKAEKAKLGQLGLKK